MSLKLISLDDMEYTQKLCFLHKSSSVHSVHPLCEDVCRGTASEVAFGAGSSKDIAKRKEASKEERRELYEL